MTSSERRQAQANLVTEALSTATTEPGANWNPYYSFVKFFELRGFKKAEIAKLQALFYQDGLQPTSFPMRNHAEDFQNTLKNPANNNKEGVKECISAAGGNPDDRATWTAEVIRSAEQKCSAKTSGSSSMLQSSASAGLATAGEPWGSLPWASNQVSANVASVEYLSGAMNMLSGSVATNTAAVAGLTSAVTSNVASLSAIQGQVGLMSQVAAPTVALASSLGVQTGTVATLAMAGSFVGPLLGVIALIYVTWPEEEIDPWLKIEARVSKMITDKFDANRRKRLGDRMRRYVKQFSQCAKAWVSKSMVKDHGISLPKWIVDTAESSRKTGNFNFTLQGSIAKLEHRPEYPAPPCMEELEGHMSLERDEWYNTEGGQIGGLFMPFANMHTQMLSMLADHPYDDKMQWKSALQSTSAEYGNYMLSHVLDAWKAQVCRTVRLRQSLKSGIYWRYQFVVLRPKYQPHAGEDCSSMCNSQNGWCDWCGGKSVGACCKKGDTSGVCGQFDPPEGTFSAYMSCVHTDCIQSNTYYKGTEVKKVSGNTPEECQQMCQDYAEATAFSYSGDECTCLKADGLQRRYHEGSHSGPTVCGKPDDSLEAREEAYEDNLVEVMPNAPMEEVEACEEKSPSVSNYAEVEKNHPEWVKKCYANVTKVVAAEFNTFYKRIGKFMDSMTWMASCGAKRELEWNEGGWMAVSDKFDAGSFQECDWALEEEMDKKTDRWYADHEMSRGWTGTSKVNMDEQKTATMQYPMPSWLHDIKRQLSCLKNTAAGQVADVSDGRSTAVNTVMDSVSMTNDQMRASSQ